MANQKIVSVEIKQPEKFGDMAHIHVKVAGDSAKFLLFSYFADEISFSSAELLGLTVEQANELHHRKDVAYLRS
jgi:hypothetical protein